MPVRKGNELLVADYQENSDSKYDKTIHVLHKCTYKRLPEGNGSLS